ncbi:hypothetical protein K458DRAFT_395422 [Lentithecium fluviatile CBS 122367]|uniref:Uncharacterized protein n=1 Tax=Lentithecium fluviatile CBS 122367 TaxID=1168545 RepID=A0A6G1IJ74_9PLEO|nr:hypothetical protein K458DRAFT_395422 [Lentithecium fluviatile CBS 122367]
MTYGYDAKFNCFTSQQDLTRATPHSTEDPAKFSGRKDPNFCAVVNSLEMWYKDYRSGKDMPRPITQVAKKALHIEDVVVLGHDSTGNFFEIPFLPWESFRGREDVLEKMTEYFCDGQQKLPTYVPSGLNITESMLRRGASMKRIWDYDGELIDISAKKVGLLTDLVDLLQDQAKFDRAIEKLLAFSLIRPCNTGSRVRVFSINPLVQYAASEHVAPAVRTKWQRPAVLLVCHDFPFSTHIDESDNNFGDKGHEMLVHLPWILRSFDMLVANDRVSPDMKRSVTVMLLSSARFSQRQWKTEAISRAKNLTTDDKDGFLRCLVATAESSLLRSLGNYTESVATVEDYIGSTMLRNANRSIESNTRWNAQRGTLSISFAEALFRVNDKERAKAELEGWEPLDLSSLLSMKKVVAQRRGALLGRILKDHGNFQQSLAIFQQLFQEVGRVSDRSTGWQLTTFNKLFDLYCEVGRLLDAKTVLKQQMELVERRNWEELEPGRHLQLSLVEALIRRGDLKRTLPCLSKLQATFEALKEPKNHGGLLLFPLAQVLQSLNRSEEASSCLETAEEILKVEGKRFYVVGLGSNWFDYVHVLLGEVGPDCIASQDALISGTNTSSLLKAIGSERRRTSNEVTQETSQAKPIIKMGIVRSQTLREEEEKAHQASVFASRDDGSVAHAQNPADKKTSFEFLDREQVPDWDNIKDPVKITVLETGIDMTKPFFVAER